MFLVYWWNGFYDKETFCTTREAADRVFEGFCRTEGTVRLYECKDVNGVIVHDWDAPIRERKRVVN